MSQVSSASPRVNNVAQNAINFYVAESQKLNDDCGDESVKSARIKAQDYFVKQGLPTRRDEDWQYTPLTKFLKYTFAIKKSKSISFSQIKSFLPDFTVTRLVFVDGAFNKDLSDDLLNLSKGIVIEAGKAVSICPKTLEKELFAVLNSMLVKDGFNIKVAKNTEVATPVFILQVQTQEHHATVLQNQVFLAENSSLNLMEYSVSLESDLVGFTNFVTEFDLAKSARMKQFIVQDENKVSYHFSNQFISQAEKTLFETLYINLGSQLARHQNAVVLTGEHCETSQNSICHGIGNQIIDSRTEIDHAVPNGQSNQLHKFVLRDKSRGIFNGMIKVARDAQKTDGQMDNKNILLSTEARMDVKPQLEIYADDVKCSHGSASGQIDENQVFYLRARGIRRVDAIRLITEAFLLEPLEAITNSDIRNWATYLLKRDLESFS